MSCLKAMSQGMRKPPGHRCLRACDLCF